MLSQRGLQLLRARPGLHVRQGCQLAFRQSTQSRISSALSKARWQSQSAQTATGDEATQILVKQRLKRPVAPHLTIWRFQVHYIASGLNRITGVMLSGGFFLFYMSYAAAPYLGWELTSASVAATVAAWPVATKVLLKGTVAFPFVFHSFNGLRHLYMDVGAGFMNKQFIHTGWAVFGLSAIGTLYLASI